jgi:hypothetical protein
MCFKMLYQINRYIMVIACIDYLVLIIICLRYVFISYLYRVI